MHKCFFNNAAYTYNSAIADLYLCTWHCIVRDRDHRKITARTQVRWQSVRSNWQQITQNKNRDNKICKFVKRDACKRNTVQG